MEGHASNFSIDTILSSTSTNVNNQDFGGFANYSFRGFTHNNFGRFFTQFSPSFNPHLHSLELLASGQTFVDESAFQIKSEPAEITQDLIGSSQFTNGPQNYALPPVRYVRSLQTTNSPTGIQDNIIDYSEIQNPNEDDILSIDKQNLLKRRQKLHPVEEPQEQPSSTTDDCHQDDRNIEGLDKENDRFEDVSLCQNEDKSKQFPNWTQKQKQGWQGRRPYSRTCTIILGWWFKHFQYLTTGEMSQVGQLTGLTRQQVKIWWQNKRHTMRAKSTTGLAAVKETALEAGLPLMLPEGIRPPTPHSRRREELFKQMLHFFHIHIKPMIFYHYS